MNGNQQIEEPVEQPEIIKGHGVVPPTPILPPGLPDSRADYYRDAKRKWWDYLWGFFGVIALWLFLREVSSLIADGLYDFEAQMIVILARVIFALVFVSAIIISFKRQRRFIAFGMLTAIIFVIIGIILLLWWMVWSVTNSGGF